jgi:hypothetical protein
MNKKEQVTWVGYFLPTPLTEYYVRVGIKTLK